jgi:imidazolonepropionase-like amidohydrolase
LPAWLQPASERRHSAAVPKIRIGPQPEEDGEKKHLLLSRRVREGALIKIPPFRDAHIHFALDGRAASEEDIMEIVNACRRAGIFAVRDMGHRTGSGLAARNIAKGKLAVRTAGFALSRKDGYGAFLGRQVAGMAEIRKAVKEIALAGADFIKVINSGIVSAGEDGPVTGGGFSSEELRVICSEAGERDLAVACHANSGSAIRDAVSAGVSSIEHGFFITEECLHMMAESAVSWTPTVFALAALGSILSPSEMIYVDKVVDRHVESIALAASMGVAMSVGTDSGSKGVSHGESFVRELRFFRRAGLSLEEMILSACMDTDEIEKGNYLAVEADFIGSGKIEAVYEGGKPVHCAAE